MRAAFQEGSVDGNVLATPQVAVVIPCYQQGSFLPEAVESVVGQTYPAWEAIIVNDGSPDDTSQAARSLIERYPQARLRLIEQANQGASAARNTAIQASAAPYILPLDADDLLKPDALERMAGVLDREPAVDVVYSDYEALSGTDRQIKGSISEERIREVGPLAECIPGCALFRRSLWQRVGGYDVEMRAFEDWDFWVKVYTAGACFRRVPEVLFTYRLQGSVQGGLYREPRKMTAWFSRIVARHPQAYPAEVVDLASAALSGVIPSQAAYRYGREVLRKPRSFPISLVNLSQAAFGGLPEWPEEVCALVEEAGLGRADGDLHLSRERLAQALELLPDDPCLAVAYGEAGMKLGEAEAARRQFVKAAALHPRYLPAHLGLGRALLAQGSLEGAEAAGRKTLELSPENLEALRLLGDIYRAGGRCADSTQMYLKVLHQNPDDIYCLAGLAACCSASGDRELARNLYRKILLVDPVHALARMEMARLGQQLIEL